MREGTYTINGSRVKIYPNGDEIIYYVWNEYKERHAKINLCKWTKHPHGNAPGGTQYGSVRLNVWGQRVTVPLYL